MYLDPGWLRQRHLAQPLLRLRAGPHQAAAAARRHAHREGGQVRRESPHRRQLGPVGGRAGNRRNVNKYFSTWIQIFSRLAPDDGAALCVGVVGGGVGLVLGAGGEVPPPQLRGLVLAAILAALVLAADLAARAPAPARATQSSLKN